MDTIKATYVQKEGAGRMKRAAAIVCLLLLLAPAARAEDAIVIPEEYRNPLSDFSARDRKSVV